MFLLTTNLNVSNYRYLEPPPPFHKGGIKFFKNSYNGGGGDGKFLLKMEGEPGIGGGDWFYNG